MFFLLDGAASDIAATPLFARNVVHTSYEQTPVMGSRDALISASCTPASVRAANGLPPTSMGQKMARVTQSIESSSLRRHPHPHTIVIEGTSGVAPSPTHFLNQRYYV